MASIDKTAMKDRIKMIQNSTNLSQQDFAKMIGVAPGSLSSVYTGRTQPTSNYVQGIHKAFPNININWLMFAEGDMYVKTNVEPTEPNDLSSPAVADEATQAIGVASSLFDQDESAAADVISFRQPKRSTPLAPARTEQPQWPVVAPTAASNNLDNKKREVKEIRVFFSDGTYETFLPSK